VKEIQAIKTEADRLYFIDNLRIYMTFSVVLHHVAVIYGVQGGWYYSEYAGDTLSQIFLTIFTYLGRAFVIQFFFFIAAFFAPAAYDRKGPVSFMKERLIKLGIPLVVYSYLIGPTITYLVQYNTLSTEYSFLENIYYFKNVAPAALWFAEVLIIFSFLYVLWRLFTKVPAPDRGESGIFPSNAAIMFVALALGFITFAARIYFPATYKVFHLRPGNYPAYIAMFTLGITAYRRNWLSGINHYVYRFWMKVLAFTFLLFVGLIIYDGIFHEHAELYRGGMTWQGLFGALWENVTCMAAIICCIYLGRNYDNHQGRLLKAMSKDAFAVYVFHAPVVVGFTYFMKDVPFYPLLKFAVVFAVAAPFTFALSHYCIRKIPLAGRIL
jgi:glucans biosynthesis protein C